MFSHRLLFVALVEKNARNRAHSVAEMPNVASAYYPENREVVILHHK
jgi:hypothetical protein